VNCRRVLYARRRPTSIRREGRVKQAFAGGVVARAPGNGQFMFYEPESALARCHAVPAQTFARGGRAGVFAAQQSARARHASTAGGAAQWAVRAQAAHGGGAVRASSASGANAKMRNGRVPLKP